MEDIAPLSFFQETLVRAAFCHPVDIVRARWLQALRPCPILVEISAEHGKSAVILRIARNEGGVEREAAIYPSLRRMGLPVPRVLAGPERDSAAPELFSMSVIERLEGEPLSQWADASDYGLSLAMLLLADAYRLLRSITKVASETPQFGALPRRYLHDDFEEIVRREGDWFELAEIRGAVARLSELIDRDAVPLMSSNGDFSPANFLSDGAALTGMLDFEKAAFVDPLTVLTRLPVYDLHPLSRSGLVESLLKEHGYTDGDLATRVAIFCLRTLQTKCPVEGDASDRRDLRRHVLGVLREAMAILN